MRGREGRKDFWLTYAFVVEVVCSRGSTRRVERGEGVGRRGEFVENAVVLLVDRFSTWIQVRPLGNIGRKKIRVSSTERKEERRTGRTWTPAPWRADPPLVRNARSALEHDPRRTCSSLVIISGLSWRKIYGRKSIAREVRASGKGEGHWKETDLGKLDDLKVTFHPGHTSCQKLQVARTKVEKENSPRLRLKRERPGPRIEAARPAAQNLGRRVARDRSFVRDPSQLDIYLFEVLLRGGVSLFECVAFTWKYCRKSGAAGFEAQVWGDDVPHRMQLGLSSGTGGSWKKSPHTTIWRPPMENAEE